MLLKTLLRWCAYLFTTVIVLIAIAALTIRFFLFPNIDRYKDKIAGFASQTIDRNVSIGAIHTGWSGVSPRVTLKNVNVHDEQNRPALLLKQIDTELSWLSIGLLDLRLSELTVHEPQLMIRRSKDGVFYLAGVNLSGRGNPDFANWLLNQSEVSIHHAHITWLDELRNAPELAFTKADIKLTNSAWKSLLGNHQFSLTATPSVGTTQPVALKGYFIGRDISNIAEWYGELQAEVNDADLSVWKPWLDYPMDLQTGYGSATAKLHFAHKQIDKIEADVRLSKVSIKTAQQPEPLLADALSGTLGWSHIKQRKTFTAKNVTMALSTGIKLNGANGLLALYEKNHLPWVDANLSIGELQLDAVKATLDYFAIPDNWRQPLDALSPKGRLNALKVAFAGDPGQPSEYRISAQLHRLSFNAYQHIPGAKNISGDIEATHTHGQLSLNSQDVIIDVKDILRQPVPISQLTGQVAWNTNSKSTSVEAKNLFMTSPHITGTVNAKYTRSTSTGDHLDLVGKFDKSDMQYARFYYPITLGKETLHWLDTSIVSGRADNVTVISKGKLADFPYVNQRNQVDRRLGTFKVTADVSHAVLDYGTGWPKIEDIATHMLFEGKRMELNVKKGRISGNLIKHAKVDIPQLDADDPMLLITADVIGSIKQGLAFVNNSPVKKVAMGFTDNLHATGNGHLSLELKIPMLHLEASKVKGSYQISNGILHANDQLGLPELSKLNGTLAFTENSLTANNVHAEIFGGPMQFNLTTGPDKSIHIVASGHVQDTSLRKIGQHPLLDALQGSTDWQGDINIKKPLADIRITTNLVGMAINLPAPLNKPATQAATLAIHRQQTQADSDTIRIQYNAMLDAKLARRSQAGEMAIERGEIGIYAPANLPQNKGLHLIANLDNFDADAWLAFFNKPSASSQHVRDMNLGIFNQADISVQTLTLLNRSLHQIKLVAQPSSNRLTMNIQSQEMAGNLEWRKEQSGKLYARLKRLAIPSAKSEQPSSPARKEFRRLNQKYPALDVVVEEFEIGNKKLGKLELNAYENADHWIIQKLNIGDAHTELTADGTWRNWTRNPNTFMNFNLRSDNIGKTLKVFGHPDMVKGGKATLAGQLNWPGSPHEFDTSSLHGTFKLNAENGQISKLQPGAGRLLGLLSLQSLPRRLTLDFRDLFSEGFAFDEIRATATIANGILRSDDFFMTGPAAEASIKGETNLKAETQHLNIKVTPHVSDSVSLAALVGGPIAGVAAFVAQKLLKDPFNKIASTEYVITGTWDNPVELESRQKPDQPVNRMPIR